MDLLGARRWERLGGGRGAEGLVLSRWAESNPRWC